MRLAPCILVRANVRRFTKVARTWIHYCVQVSDVHADPVRHAVMTVAAVIVGRRWKRTGERIDARARAEAVLTPIQAGNVRIGAART